MKIALLTICKVRNFGAEMQCYATVKALRELGHDVKVIDFRLGANIYSIKSKIIHWIISISPEMRSFNKFWKQNIPFTKQFLNLKELYSEVFDVDIFISGSDQIWNLDITKEKWEPYFMPFVSSPFKIASYASSFGEAEWLWPEKKDLIEAYLKRFSKISVRESTGKQILKSTFNLDSTVVLDPTLLHKDYVELIHTPIQRNTLVYYPLTENPELSVFSKQLAKELDLKWINTNKQIKILGRIPWIRTSITDWIRNIAEAKFVVTPSFHGLAFCLIYHRQFIIIQNSPKSTRSSRITGLLEQLDLSDRYFDSIEKAKSSKIWEKTIDYNEVEKKLNELRKKSMFYISDITSED